MATPIIQVRDLTVRFHDSNDLAFLRALDRLSLDIRPGEQFALIGESGSGKSTFAKAILGQIPPTPGVVHGQITFTNAEGSWNITRGCDRVWKQVDTMFADHIVAERRPGAWRRWRAGQREQLDDLLGKRMSLITQDASGSLNPYLPVGSQVRDCMETARARSGKGVEDYLADAALTTTLADRYPDQLSGGQRQRVLIAMALASEPDLVLADEPTTGLDVLSKTRIIELFARLVDREAGGHGRRMTFLVITHDLDIVRRIATRVGVLYQGRLMEVGPMSVTPEGRREIPCRHPYTEMLAGSYDDLEYGYAPPARTDAGGPRVGCRYCGRCQVYAACRREKRRTPYQEALLRRCEMHEPPLYAVDGPGGESRVRCWDRIPEEAWNETDTPWEPLASEG